MERRKIKDLITDKAILEIQDGNHGEKHPTAADYVVQGIPFLMARDFQNGQVDLSGACKIPKPLGDSLRIGFARTGDVLLTHKGTVGLVAIVPEVPAYVMLTPQVTYYRTNPTKLLNSYLKYAFQAPFFRDQLNSFSAQSTRPYIGITAQKELQLDVPALPVQRRIAGILSAYDELIENSQRRIRLLEDMARALYREWFVHFRFPGRESVPRLPSALGDIPQGWEVKKLGEVATITMGLSPKGDTYNDQGDGTPLVNGPVEFGERFTKQVKWTTAPTKLCHDGDLVVCVRGSTTGKYVKSDGTYCLGRGVCGMSSTYQAYVDLLFQNELPRLLGQTSGSTFPSWTGPQLQSHPVLSPPPKLLDRFEEIVKPMSAAIATYSQRIENLRCTRDLLLPRLLSGECPISTTPITP